MAQKPKTVRAIHSNRGVEARYRRALEELIKEMSNSAEYWLAAQYRQAPPEIAEDALPAAEMAARLTAKTPKGAPTTVSAPVSVITGDTGVA